MGGEYNFYLQEIMKALKGINKELKEIKLELKKQNENKDEENS